jgi:hypothetical protein
MGDWIFATGELKNNILMASMISILESQVSIADKQERQDVEEAVLIPVPVEPTLTFLPLEQKLPVEVSEPTKPNSLFKQPLLGQMVKRPLLGQMAKQDTSEVKEEIIVPPKEVVVSHVATLPVTNIFQRPKMSFGKPIPPSATSAPVKSVSVPAFPLRRMVDIEEYEEKQDTQLLPDTPNAPRTSPDSIDKDIPW